MFTSQLSNWEYFITWQDQVCSMSNLGTDCSLETQLLLEIIEQTLTINVYMFIYNILERLGNWVTLAIFTLVIKIGL